MILPLSSSYLEVFRRGALLIYHLAFMLNSQRCHVGHLLAGAAEVAAGKTLGLTQALMYGLSHDAKKPKQ